MKIFDDNFNTFNKPNNSDATTISNINNQTFFNSQGHSAYNDVYNEQIEPDMDNISDNFERDARRYSKGFETGVIY